MKTQEEILDALAGHHGTSEYYPTHKTRSFTVVITEGVQHLCEIANCYWLIDVIWSYQLTKCKGVERQEWFIEKKGTEAFVWCINAHTRQEIVRQHIDITTFPLDRYELWAALTSDGEDDSMIYLVVYLPQED